MYFKIRRGEKTAAGDDRMAAGIKNKKESAFRTFIARFYNCIYHECLKKTGDRDELPDHVNEILLKCYTGIGRYDCEKSKLSTWVMRVARNYLRDRRRADRRRPELVNCGDEFFDYLPAENGNGGAEGAAGGSRADNDINRAVLKLALSRMKKRHRQILRYRADGMAYRDIAGIMKISENNAMALHTRAAKRLKKLFLEEMEERGVKDFNCEERDPGGMKNDPGVTERGENGIPFPVRVRGAGKRVGRG